MTKSYGVLRQRSAETLSETVEEEIRILGFSIVPGLLHEPEIGDLSSRAEKQFAEVDNQTESEILRAPGLRDPEFLRHSGMRLMLQVASSLIPGRVILNQQNLLRNPPLERDFSQARFHRDFPYQHFVASRPLGINVLLTLDDFSTTNGGTSVIPGSHRVEEFPSSKFVEKHKFQVQAPAGSLIFLDTMLYHAAGENRSQSYRKAINHVFSSPLIAQQIPMNTNELARRQFREDPEVSQLLGIDIGTYSPS